MDTGKETKQIGIAFINDKSPIIDAISNDLSTSGFEILFKSENIEDGITQLSELKSLPQSCIIDLDFYDKNVLTQLQVLKSQYPSVKFIAHGDTDDVKIVKALLKVGCAGYLLIGSDVEDFRKAIESVSNG